MTDSVLPVSEPVHVGQARSLATAVARGQDLPDELVDRVALTASELATNLVKYARGGLLAVSTGPLGLDLIATDSGPGLRDVEDSMRDGFSTAGSMGAGLGSVRRLADRFDVFTRRGEGTTVLARWVRGTPQWRGVRIGSVLFTAPGETVSGDGWTAVTAEGIVTIVLTDGLGHGPLAAEASEAAIGHVAADPRGSPAALLAAMDDDPAAARGATVALAQFDLARGTLTFSGVGNITARLLGEGGARETLVSVPGIVGRRQRRGRRANALVRPWSAESWLIMHTDGVSERWASSDWPGLFEHDPATVAGWVLGQHIRLRDDACVLAIAGGEGP
ncbi:ATP-binding protein [Prauserella cavernicola]|uniref:ATP-binding protein n=1 Tax=Prauserella cavernicola TaxID=2800127 RepID=A0A934V2F0_9PSEU|nr:ATP-binding protein [Prauserella cavernicola]MBK1785606.1 ATP-binding protein [Prauserella cavernicola]